jgi:hypothetical protein
MSEITRQEFIRRSLIFSGLHAASEINEGI